MPHVQWADQWTRCLTCKVFFGVWKTPSNLNSVEVVIEVYVPPYSHKTTKKFGVKYDTVLFHPQEDISIETFPVYDQNIL